MANSDSNRNVVSIGTACEFTISIIICTCNRAASLKRTLEALDETRIPEAWKVEVIVVDNCSTDGTKQVVGKARLSRMELRYVYEPKKGKGNAYNAGLSSALGEIIIFTDDDALPCEEWVEKLGNALLGGKYDAVTGRIVLAGCLMRPWLTAEHRWWLGSSDDAKVWNGTRELIGCNMGFRREVLETLPAFDPELGPGGLGFGDDGLFGFQLCEAGFRIGYVPEACVVHDFDVSRLTREHWLDAAAKRGRTEAYLSYHWVHSDIRFARLKWLLSAIKLQVRRILQPQLPLQSEGCSLWEMSHVLYMEKCRHFCVERQRARNFSVRGLTKIGLVRKPAIEEGRPEEAVSNSVL